MPKLSEKDKKPSIDLNPNMERIINSLIPPLPQASDMLQDQASHAGASAGDGLSPSGRKDFLFQATNVLSVHEELQVDSHHVPPQQHKNDQILSKTLVGRDQAFDEVCNFLHKEEVKMVGIYGMGGVGKTRFMTKIHEDFLKPSNFKVISLVVSKVVDVDRIQKDMMEEMNLFFNKGGYRHKRAEQISEALAKEEKIALLLDDIWEFLDLIELGILSPVGLDKSNIKTIFTTRLEKVCSGMQPDREVRIECLGWDDSWSLFEKNVGKKTINSDYKIPDLAKEVAKECKGLPLALIVIGRSMTCKYTPSEWEHALTTLQKYPFEVLDATEKLFPRLELSYNALPDRGEKDCFLYCCLFHEDREIDSSELVEYWIGEGYLDSHGSFKEAFNRGYDILGTLLSACLLEGNIFKNVKMHDVIRDMGLWISSKLKTSFYVHEGGSNWTKTQIVDKWREAHKMYVLRGHQLPDQPFCLNLSTLIFHNGYLERKLKISNDFLKCLHKVSVLELREIDFLDDPVELVHLLELKYLKISWTNLKTLSKDIGKLSKLELLYFCNNQGLDELPPSIGQMLSLKKFKCNPCPRVLPVELANLGKLEVLEFGKWDKGYILFHIRPIKEIPTSIFQNLVELRTLHLVVTSTNVLPMNLWDFTKLEDLTVYIQEVELGPAIIGEKQSLGCNDVPKGMNDVANPSGLDEDILILDNLKRLSCCPLKHLRLANWPVTSWYELLSILQSLHKLLELHVARFPLRELILLTSKRFYALTKLQVLNCPILEKIQFGNMELQNLRILRIRDCSSLKYFSGLHHLGALVELLIDEGNIEGELIKEDEEAKGGHICFPYLKVLQVKRLFKLNSICSDTVSFPSIAEFTLINCPKLEKLPLGLVNNSGPKSCIVRGTQEWWDRLLWANDQIRSLVLPYFGEIDNDGDNEYYESVHRNLKTHKMNFIDLEDL